LIQLPAPNIVTLAAPREVPRGRLIHSSYILTAPDLPCDSHARYVHKVAELVHAQALGVFCRAQNNLVLSSALWAYYLCCFRFFFVFSGYNSRVEYISVMT